MSWGLASRPWSGDSEGCCSGRAQCSSLCVVELRLREVGAGNPQTPEHKSVNLIGAGSKTVQCESLNVMEAGPGTPQHNPVNLIGAGNPQTPEHKPVNSTEAGTKTVQCESVGVPEAGPEILQHSPVTALRKKTQFPAAAALGVYGFQSGAAARKQGVSVVRFCCVR